MKVLVDECVPRFLRSVLVGHEAQTVQDCGWGGIKNGELLALAEGRFDVFLTSDQNLRYQQNLAKRRIAIIELPTNRRRIVKSLVLKIIETLKIVVPGAYVQIDWPEIE